MIDIPQHVFKYTKIADNIMAEQKKFSNIEKASFDNGLYLYFQNAEYPMRGIPNVNIIASINIMKALFVEILKIRFDYLSVFTAFNRIGMKVMSEHILKDEYMSPQIRELKKILYNFTLKLTSNSIVSTNFADIVSHLVEYDIAYRLRFVDLASEANKEMFVSNSKKELKRLVHIWRSREVMHKGSMTNKIDRAIQYVPYLLSIPKIRKALQFALQQADFSKMRYDNIDMYWACLREDYDHMGLSYDKRLEIINNNGYSIPTLQT